MADRITTNDVKRVVERAQESWQRLTGDARTWTLTPGSKANGVTWAVHFTSTGTAAPGTRFGGSVGFTASEAFTTLDTIARTLDDLAHHQRTTKE